jgi:acyl-CoA synthetase (AMP-forming)/AMP-acid ligase II
VVSSPWQRSGASLVPKAPFLTTSLSSTSSHARSFSTINKPVFPFTTLVDLQAQSCTLFSDRPCFGSRSDKGDKYVWVTYGEFGRRVEKFRNVLVHHRIGKGDKVALISNNRVEWAVAFYAVASVGGSVVPMYEAQVSSRWGG